MRGLPKLANPPRARSREACSPLSSKRCLFGAIDVDRDGSDKLVSLDRNPKVDAAPFVARLSPLERHEGLVVLGQQFGMVARWRPCAANALLKSIRFRFRFNVPTRKTIVAKEHFAPGQTRLTAHVRATPNRKTIRMRSLLYLSELQRQTAKSPFKSKD